MKIHDRKTIDKNGCWIWTGAIKNSGKNSFPYGWVAYLGTQMNAHRASWIEANGPIPNGLFVCHKCDVPACINPEHLFLGTPSDNMKDMWNKKRHKNVNEGIVGSQSSKLSLNDVQIIREMIKFGFAQKEIAAMYEINQATVSLINTGKNWGRYV